MAAIDNLLKALVDNRMDSLVLEAGRLPRLIRDDAEHEVTRTRLTPETLSRLIAEVAGQPLPPPADAAPGRFTYRLEGRPFTFDATPQTDGWRVVVRPEGGANGTTATEPPGQAPTPAAATPARGSEEPGGTAGSELPPAPAAPAAPTAGAAGRAIPSIESLLLEMVEKGASDLHVSSRQEVRMRIDGELNPVPDYHPPEPEELERLLFEIAPEPQQKEFQSTRDVDFGHEIPDTARFRVNYYADRRGIAASFRLIPTSIPSFEDLGLPGVLEKIGDLPKGLVLVTGPTGSGKSTTLATVLDRINRTRRDHIITIEDPIEFVHPSRNCLVHQRQVGLHTESFARALRAALREDPDIVLVGEMRDLETSAIALETAETGHLVFGTLHTTSAVATVDRLVDQYPPDQQEQIRMMLADSLKAVVSQNLLKRKAGGRVAAFEVLLVSPAISNMIREGKTFQMTSAMQTGRSKGMRLLNDSLVELVREDVVDPLEAYLKAAEKEDLLKRFGTAGIDTGFLEQGTAQGIGET